MECNGFAGHANNPLEIHDARSGETQAYDIATAGFVESVGEAIHEIHAIVICRQHTGAFDSDREQDEFADCDTEDHDDYDPNQSDARIAPYGNYLNP